MVTSKKPQSKSRQPKAKQPQGDTRTTELLLEIGTEELPSHFVPPALQNLAQSAERLLKEYRLSHGMIRALGTPRRLVLAVDSLAAQQAATVKETMGPPRTAAFDAQGQPTKAASGFAASQGMAVGDLEIRQTPKGDYMCAVKRERGSPARSVLQQMLPVLIENLSFPKTMRWNESGVRFARPIRWLLALCGGRTIPIEVGGVRAGDRTWGHRFLGAKGSALSRGLSVNKIATYLSELERHGVIPDQSRRRAMILDQVKRLADSVQGQLDQDEHLLEEAIFSVEYPQAILGAFDPAYLSLPDDVLKTSMKEHQGFFPVSGKDGTLLPRFISVTNMRLASMALIREGNERVLAARLADAKFFFEEDRKTTLADRVDKLKSVVFHQKLGTLHHKTGRVMALAAKIADLLGDLDLQETVRRAAQLSKADLLTGMVGEFPTLQGIMGGEYARVDGEPQEVSVAISDQYLPRAMEGELPRTRAGQVLSLADRLDTIVAFFHVGMVPTGSEDPFALRRHASAVVRILIEGTLRFDLREILAHAKLNVETQGFQSTPVQPGTERHHAPDAVEFITDRVRFYGRTVHSLRDDVMEAVLKGGVDRPFDLVDLLARMQSLQAITRRPEFDPLMIGFKRAHRLTEKEQWDRNEIDPTRFQDPTEEKLYRQLREATARVPECLAQGNYTEGLDILVGMKPAIDAFFDGVMVNAEDPALRSNRLSLLDAVDELFMSFADFSQILVESK